MNGCGWDGLDACGRDGVDGRNGRNFLGVVWIHLYAALLSCLCRRCLELVELLAMFAPGNLPGALAEVMPFVQV